MECPYCGSELKYIDYYGKLQHAEHYYTYPQSWIEKTGDIYQCPNYEGFENEDEAKDYQSRHEDLKGMDWEGVTCQSSEFNGHFYTDRSGELQEGYPC